jgi:hypothetical protein
MFHSQLAVDFSIAHMSVTVRDEAVGEDCANVSSEVSDGWMGVLAAMTQVLTTILQRSF